MNEIINDQQPKSPEVSVKSKLDFFLWYRKKVQINQKEVVQPRLLSAKRLNRKMSRIGCGLFKKIGDKYLSLYSPDGGNPA
ncbi:MAG: hypothetical protein A3C79_00405 [Candidatus Taylorbacteria bacterium RIFCSPHIGHO2_02_FULL_45_28]|uniref:Uncharacterized protein n=1 Tax=Candidatus Taylorbacteria bacterium RIFCSPHIGHO2_12_FULL_45_16 TaxID=1802315 RepID=A0A1G2MZ88_9BACT|nr:MAG: hypothetical protein A2830_01660 [Candidatus Taylorbacteria bacterium RIFCSPHIGHO2_01_FULL_44_110]OHA25483.1 MAG: hypothetical protein A3C79_00405 [Candidatus Taylorbacteria bacterium RIFCSPHIGHO2_02_FULL_45_28]OHA29150.1 MAG: hypothetical protein A3F51_00870 [Candidatus Taylorbacteria bacterium RIFCSPHIGHO2_12_FULL_45_16]OHA33372.1 MAG: hypothetical protein A3A23_01750 [Candidatus Taylorbacteria bacterium RIFCSPLOWO2_01_FULL_45_59]OHA39884.1 MAG: hypothetical protein A3I98_01790 [Candi